jgi:pimeloyl-ACP methyl ester carboxylesterase
VSVPEPFNIASAGAEIRGEQDGPGGPARGTAVLLHGLTATRRYVVMGSRSLERAGVRVISYDARGHGESGPGRDGYTYASLAADLLAVLDGVGVERAVLAGASMGAHTLLRFALDHPDRVDGLVVITPAFEGPLRDPGHWDRLADGLRRGGVDGFVAAYDFGSVDPALRGTVETVIRQRLSRHRDLGALADAVSGVPRSAPFASVEDLAQVTAPAAIIASGDAADPEHPQRVAEAYAAAMPNARLILDEPGRSPRAWQGSQVSAIIADVVGESPG